MCCNYKLSNYTFIIGKGLWEIFLNKKWKRRRWNRHNETTSPDFENICTQSSEFDEHGIITTQNGRILSKYQWQRDYTRVNRDVRDKLRLWSPHHLRSPIRLRIIAEKHKSANRMYSPIIHDDMKIKNSTWIVSIYNCSQWLI